METYYSRNKEKILARCKKYRAENRELFSLRSKKYYEKNRNIIARKAKERKKRNPKEFLAYQATVQKKYRERHTELVEQKRKEYEQKNRELINLRKRVRREKKEEKDKMAVYSKEYNSRPEVVERRRLKYLEDNNFKLSMILRGRLSKALRDKNRKAGSAVKDLGCTLDELKTYLEAQFKDGMSWENRGIWGWHIDHKIPLSSFDLTDREQFIRACHYTNLQPLWREDNLKKGICKQLN